MSPKTSTLLPWEERAVRLGVNPNHCGKRKPRALTVVWVEGQKCLSVPLTQGEKAIIDYRDGPLISTHNWMLLKCKRKGGSQLYAVRRTKYSDDWHGISEVTMMHGAIIWPITEKVDHVNGNGLDNRRKNLRPANSHQNGANARLMWRSVTGYKGVTKSNYKHRTNRPTNKLWRARITVNRKHISLGAFTCKHEAAKAYNAAAVKHFGEFARLNTIYERVAE